MSTAEPACECDKIGAGGHVEYCPAQQQPARPECSCQPEAITKGRPERSICFDCGRPLFCFRHGSNYADMVCGPGPCGDWPARDMGATESPFPTGNEADVTYWRERADRLEREYNTGAELSRNVIAALRAERDALRADRDNILGLLTCYVTNTTMEAHEWREVERAAREVCGV